MARSIIPNGLTMIIRPACNRVNFLQKKIRLPKNSFKVRGQGAGMAHIE